MEWSDTLISYYLYVCKAYETKLSFYMERFSRHSDLKFSDEEVMTIYLYGIMEKRRTIIDIYDFTKKHLSGWFPNLPSYGGFVQRLNKVSHLFELLFGQAQQELLADNNNLEQVFLMDSMPIVLAKQGRRFHAKIAHDIASSDGYCATKNLYYHGVKLHVCAIRQKGSLPIPLFLQVTNASEADIRVYEKILKMLPCGVKIFADKAYQTERKPIKMQEDNKVLLTPVKKKKGQKSLSFGQSLLSKAISSVRQPIESLFNWIEEKTSIQTASKVRSSQGLITHIAGKMTVAILNLKLNLSS
jgi:Transposase DDE domain